MLSHFKKSEFFKSSSNKKFIAVKNKITEIAPWAEVKLIGGTAIPGALTKGDVDLLVRVHKNKFLKTKSLLKEMFEENNQEFWNNEFAIFKDITSFNEKN